MAKDFFYGFNFSFMQLRIGMRDKRASRQRAFLNFRLRLLKNLGIIQFDLGQSKNLNELIFKISKTSSTGALPG